MPRDNIDVERTNLNLFREDKRMMERAYGVGWTERVRALVHEHCMYLRKRDDARIGSDDD